MLLVPSRYWHRQSQIAGTRLIALQQLVDCTISMGLWLFDEQISLAVAYRLWCKVWELHTSGCGTAVGLRRSAPRQQWYSHLNDIIWCAMKCAQMPATKELVRLIQQDSKRLWHHHSTMVSRKASGVGRYSPRQLCNVPPDQFSHRGRQECQLTFLWLTRMLSTQQAVVYLAFLAFSA